MRRRIIRGSAAICAGALFAMGGASLASADDADPPAEPVPNVPVATTVTTLPLFGAQLTVDVTVGAGGTLTSVALNPASDDWTATKVKPNKVAFVNEDGTAKVKVAAKHGSQGVAAKAGSLADISGDGSWAGDVFGTGTTTTVSFTIGDAGDGTPDITNVVSSDPTATVGEVRHGDHHKTDWAVVAVKFTNAGQARSLWINASVSTWHERSKATLSIWLSDTKGIPQPAAEAAGPHTWNGTLCDGTPASIAYTVAEDGTVSDVSATPDSATVKVREHGLSVKFSDHESVTISVKERSDHLKISVDERFRCGRGVPTITGATVAPDASDGDGWRAGRGWGDGDRDGRDGRRGDDHDDHDEHGDRDGDGRDGWDGKKDR